MSFTRATASKTHRFAANPTENTIFGKLSLMHLTPRNVNAFTLRFHKNKVYPFTVSSQLDSKAKPLYNHYAERWANRAEPFWWIATCHKAISAKAVVRHWATRRLRRAFIESLAKKGYDKDGNRNSGQGAALMGSASLVSKEDMMKIGHKDLVKQTDSAVEALLKQLQPINGVRRP